ncbi:MAG TPA: tetratricopeptide repeat protein [Roseiflexaceae bacterium]|nr:tetratricopeptide repeat protein [Roseiflexaceae bacterium]
MTLARHRLFLPALALALIGAATALSLSLRGASLPPALPAPNAAQRPVTRTDRLIWDYQEIVRREPQNVDAHAVLGAAYLQKARETADPAYYAKAGQVLDAALRLDGRHVDALVARGALALARHNFGEALALGEQARAISPDTARVYGVIADAQIELGMYEAAVETIQTMVDLRPDLGSYSRVAYARELYGDLGGAIEAMEQAVSAGGPAPENTEWTRVQLGNLHFARGDLAAAEAQYRRSLAMLPDYVYAQAGLARVRAAQGRTGEALALYRRAIERAPLPEFVIALGETLEAAGRRDEAAAQYELVRAMQRLFKAGGVDTDLELAQFEADHGADPQAALTMARAAYARRPGVKAADTLAWALHRAGAHAEARRYAEEALRLGTQDALMLYHAGMIARAQGDAAAARAYLGRALALNPHFSPLYAPAAREALAGLDKVTR